MSPDITNQLRSQMEQVQVLVPRDLAQRASRGHRRRQFTVRAVSAAAAAVVIGAGTAVAAGVTRSAPVTPAQTTAYVVSHVTGALGDQSLIEYTDTYFTVAPGAARGYDRLEWAYRDSWRQETVTPAGGPILDQGGTFTSYGETGLNVSYLSRTWYRWVDTFKQEKRPGQPDVCESGGFLGQLANADYAVDFRSEIEQGLRCGVYKLDGRQRIDGVDAIRLIADFYGPRTKATAVRQRPDMVQTLWIDPATFLPLQTRLDTLGHMYMMGAGKGGSTIVKYVTVNFTWLRPTKASRGLLTPPIPAGFRQVSG